MRHNDFTTLTPYERAKDNVKKMKETSEVKVFSIEIEVHGVVINSVPKTALTKDIKLN